MRLAVAYCRLVWLLCFLSFRYWALAVPSFVIVAVALSMVIYMGLNFLATPPPTSFSTIFGDTQFLPTSCGPIVLQLLVPRYSLHVLRSCFSLAIQCWFSSGTARPS